MTTNKITKNIRTYIEQFEGDFKAPIHIRTLRECREALEHDMEFSPVGLWPRARYEKICMKKYRQCVLDNREYHRDDDDGFVQ